MVVPATVPSVLYLVAVTRYAVMAEPPLDDGADQRAIAVNSPPRAPDVALPIEGVEGTPAAVTVADRADTAPVPKALTAATSKLRD